MTVLSPRAGEGPPGVPTFITLVLMCCNCQRFVAWVSCLYMSPVPRQGLGSYCPRMKREAKARGGGLSLQGNCRQGRPFLPELGGQPGRPRCRTLTHPLLRLSSAAGAGPRGGLTPAQCSSDSHYVWQPVWLCVLGGSGLRTRRPGRFLARVGWARPASLPPHPSLCPSASLRTWGRG